MKKISLAICLLIVSFCAFAQKNNTNLPEPALPIDERTNLVTYQDVIQEEGTPQVLYDRAMDWIKKYYKNTNEVIKNADAEKLRASFQNACERATNGKFRYSFPSEGSVWLENPELTKEILKDGVKMSFT